MSHSSHPERCDIDVLLHNSQKLPCNSCDLEIVQAISLGDSSLRTGLICLTFVTGENALDTKKGFITSSQIVGWVIEKKNLLCSVTWSVLFFLLQDL